MPQNHAEDEKSRPMTEMSFTEAVNATIKAEASAQGIGLRDLSIASGFESKETIRNYINRKRPMDTDKIEAIAEKGLGMSADDFIGLVMQRIERSRK